MRSFKFMLIAALVLSMGTMAYAELQSVTTSGSLRIRGNTYDLDTMGDMSFVEQRTKLGVTADFTDDVSVFIEVDTYDAWGADFRSFYPTGVDMAAPGGDVNMYQAYINAANMYDTDLSLRVGRQELVFGSEFIFGNNDTSSFFTGLSYDALRLTYATDTWTLDGVWAKLAEGAIGDEFGDGDVDLYTLYASYLGLEDIVIDGYWAFIREENSTPAVGVMGGFLGVAAESDLHTIGARIAGTYGAFDFEGEAAFQFGDIETAAGDVDWEGWAIDMELGYTFDASYQPRIFLGFAFLEGPDSTDAGFNRVFSDVEYSEFLANTDLSNFWMINGGVSMQPTESTELALVISYFQADEDGPMGDDDLGVELGLYGTYHYSEDLIFNAGYAHFFGDEALGDAYVAGNGTATVFADDDDLDYLFIETMISF